MKRPPIYVTIKAVRGAGAHQLADNFYEFIKKHRLGNSVSFQNSGNKRKETNADIQVFVKFTDLNLVENKTWNKQRKVK